MFSYSGGAGSFVFKSVCFPQDFVSVDSGVGASSEVAVHISYLSSGDSVSVVSNVCIYQFFILSVKIIVFLVTDLECSFKFMGKALQNVYSLQEDAIFVLNGVEIILIFGS